MNTGMEFKTPRISALNSPTYKERGIVIFTHICLVSTYDTGHVVLEVVRTVVKVTSLLSVQESGLSESKKDLLLALTVPQNASSPGYAMGSSFSHNCMWPCFF